MSQKDFGIWTMQCSITLCWSKLSLYYLGYRVASLLSWTKKAWKQGCTGVKSMDVFQCLLFPATRITPVYLYCLFSGHLTGNKILPPWHASKAPSSFLTWTLYRYLTWAWSRLHTWITQFSNIDTISYYDHNFNKMNSVHRITRLAKKK